MATITLGGTETTTSGELPAVGEAAPAFTLTTPELGQLTSDELAGQRVVLNIFPSVQTKTCAASVREFSKRAADLPDTVVVNVSADLPFAQAGFCAAEGIEGVRMGSSFRDGAFLQDYGVRIMGGRFEGLAARAVVVLDADGTVLHSQLVSEVGQEPDYEAALAVL
jgi:thioredoxin-dependent peroxiredoxin